MNRSLFSVIGLKNWNNNLKNVLVGLWFVFCAGSLILVWDWLPWEKAPLFGILMFALMLAGSSSICYALAKINWIIDRDTKK